MASLFEEMGGTYTLGADGMYYPDLELPEEETPRYGKYGRMRHTYLREHKKVYYTTLLFDGKLVAHPMPKWNRLSSRWQNPRELPTHSKHRINSPGSEL